MIEKGIPFELQTEVPWDSTTKTPQYNPLEKLPVLITETGNAIYESHFILEWIEYNYPPPKYPAIYPQVKDRELFAKQVQVVTDGICDACVLMFFEKQRQNPSQEWISRQLRKVDGGLKALSQWVDDKEFIVQNKFSLADISAGTVLGYMKVRFSENNWEEKYPNLKKYMNGLDKRESFQQTIPYPQKINDKIV